MSISSVSLEDSILKTMRHLLVGSDEENSFDTEIKLHVNSVFSRLYTLGVGPLSGFQVLDEDTTWNDFLSTEDNLELLKTYIYIKVRLVFDPPSNTTAFNSMSELVKEYEWILANCSMDRSNEMNTILEGDQNQNGNESC